MKKLSSILLSAVLIVGASLGLVGCGEEKFEYIYLPDEYYAVVTDTLGNEYKVDVAAAGDLSERIVECDLEFFARNNALWTVGLQGLYAKDGTPIASELYLSQFENTEVIDLSFVGASVMKKSCEILYQIKGDRGNEGKKSDYKLTFQFNVTVKPDKTLHQYVTIRDVEIPYDYFACDMQEVYPNSYDLNAFQDMLGVYNNTDDFEYGYSYKHFAADDTVLNYTSIVTRQQTHGGVVFGTKRLHSVDPYVKYGREDYEYSQIQGTNGYILNETDGIFTPSRFTRGEPGVADSGWSDYMPNNLDVVRTGTDLVYRAGQKDGYLYLSISGILQDFFHTTPTEITATYKIQDNKIVAWLYEESCPVSAQEDEYWRTAHYCIPLEGEIELLDETLLDFVVTSRGD